MGRRAERRATCMPCPACMPYKRLLTLVREVGHSSTCMTRRRHAAAAVVALLTFFANDPRPAAQTPQNRIVVTEHQVSVGGRLLRYAAHVGHLPILDHETGDVHAHMFFTAYTLQRGAGDPIRPVTFLWN